MKLSQVEELSIKMHSGSYSENVIIKEIKNVKNLEETDRDGRTLLVNAAFYNCLGVVEHLIQCGVNLNAKDKMGYTALHAAAQEGNIEIIEKLLENGVDVNIKNFFGNSPLMVVRMINRPIKTIAMLLCYGADPHQKNNYGNSAVDIFISNPEITSLLTNHVCQSGDVIGES